MLKGELQNASYTNTLNCHNYLNKYEELTKRLFTQKMENYL